MTPSTLDLIGGCLGGAVMRPGGLSGGSWRSVSAAECLDRVVWDRADYRVITAVGAERDPV